MGQVLEDVGLLEAGVNGAGNTVIFIWRAIAEAAKVVVTPLGAVAKKVVVAEGIVWRVYALPGNITAVRGAVDIVVAIDGRSAGA